MTGEILLDFAALPIAAYLTGSTPFGVIIARGHDINLRKTGSGNVGATNVGRVVGKKWGYLCFILDVLKGLLPVLLAGIYLHGAGDEILPLYKQSAWLAVAFGAIAGHVFSFWLKFHGGKGVATSLGVLLGFYPYFTWAGLVALGIWIVVVILWRYVSLASIIAAGAFPPLFLGDCLLSGWPVGQLWPLLAFATAMAGLVIIRHRSNIARLLKGTENKIKKRRRTGDG